MEKLDGKTRDIVRDNINKLKEIFPEAFTENKIDFEKLQEILGEDIEKGREIYEFTWPGKSEALRLSQKTSTGTLRPNKASSKDWENTKNLYIEGDNLEVLKLLQRSYYKKVKMIYIDPPYNTGNDFVYKDDFRDNIKNYKELTLQSMKANPETSGRYHSDWLNMMYPRLRLAKNLLSDDGVIFISIDDNEVHNLRKVCDEIFGEDNFICNFVRKNKAGSGHDSNKIAIEFDYILCYSKNYFSQNIYQEEIDTESDDKYKLIDSHVKERGKYYLRDLDYKGSYSDGLDYPITAPDGSVIYSGGAFGKPNTWRWSKDKFDWGQKNDYIVFKETSEKWKVYIKQYQYVDNKGEPYVRTIPYRALIDYQNGQGTIDFNSIMEVNVFNYPKPIKLLYHFQRITTEKDSIVLDFFSGSATTAHAVMQLNAEDGGNRQFIMVQLPEPTDGDSEAYKAGYKSISEIGMERIRRAGEKIKEENKDKEGIENLDTGFKVLKLDSSNIKRWDSSPDNLEDHLWDMVNPIKEDRSDMDIVYEIMVKYGINLTLNIEEIMVAGKKAYSIGKGYLIVCLDKDITLDVIEEIGKLKPERAVFLDSGFADDNVKINAVQILKKFGVDDFRSI